MGPIADDETLPVETRMLLAIARIETKLDNSLEKLADHEGRLRQIEERAASPLRAYAIPLSLFGTFGSLALALTALILK